jgi:hypothetical protein
MGSKTDRGAAVKSIVYHIFKPRPVGLHIAETFLFGLEFIVGIEARLALGLVVAF